MLIRALLFGALLIALIVDPGRADASTHRTCSMLSRVDRVSRAAGSQLDVDLFGRGRQSTHTSTLRLRHATVAQ